MSKFPPNESLDFYKLIFEENKNVVLIIDKNSGDIVHANQSACNYYKYDYSQLTSLKISDINILSSEEIKIEMEKASSEKRSFFDFTHRLGNNELRRVEVKSTPITIGDKIYLYSIINDVKEKNEREEMITELFYESPNAMVILDGDANLIAVNKSFSSLFGYELGDFKDHTLAELMAESNHQEELLNNINRVMNGEILNLNSRRRTKNNRLIEVNIVATPYINNEKIYGALVVYNDITEQQRIKSEIERIKQSTFDEIKVTNDKLQLILDSTVEAIVGIDINGNCTFCNASGFRMLGYTSQEEVFNKNILHLVYKSDNKGKKNKRAESKIMQALKEGKVIRVDDEVFYRNDGTYFDVEYFFHPQIINGNLTGAVITFVDITERKRTEAFINYISYHDTLTGLYNREYFEMEIKRIDTKENLPISIIYGDINGLKLTNDIFGHNAGDEFLKNATNILKKSCGNKGIISRVGGDEFTILLLNTNKDEAKKLVNKINREFLKERFKAFQCSISLGYDTKDSTDQDIAKIMEMAESLMYRQKISSRRITNTNMINEIIDTLHSKNEKEMMHSERVTKVAVAIAKEMGMSETEIRKTHDAAFLHDIGKIAFSDEMLRANHLLNDEEKDKKKQHVVIGYRILNLFDETIDLSEYVLNHHEYYNGSGYPKGLAGEEIPLISRIIALAENFDYLTNPFNNNRLPLIEAINEISKESGKKFDPKIVDYFTKCIKKVDFE